MPVVVYTKNNCPFCDRVKAYLDAKGVEYEARNIQESYAAMEEIVALGVMGVPVTIKGDDMVVGYDEAKLKEVLGVH